MAKETHAWRRACGRFGLRRFAVAGAAVCVLVFGGTLFACSRPVPQAPDPSQKMEVGNDSALQTETAAEKKASSFAWIDPADPLDFASAASSVLDAASGSSSVNVFDASGSTREIDPAEVPGVSEALSAFENAGYAAGFVVFDLETGKGMGCNADFSAFSASTVKAPFVAYVLEYLVDSGQVSLADELFEDMVVAGTGVMADDDQQIYDLRTVLANTIVHSDNTGYALLCETYGASGFDAWCASVGVDPSVWEGGWYPYYTPRDLAKLWLDVGAYLARGEGSAPLCYELLSQSGHSFIRDALGLEKQVVSKPGFEIDEGLYSASTAALNDAGIVSGDTGTYLIAVMSNADYDDEFYTENEPLIDNLIVALADAHDRLLAEGAVA